MIQTGFVVLASFVLVCVFSAWATALFLSSVAFMRLSSRASTRSCSSFTLARMPFSLALALSKPSWQPQRDWRDGGDLDCFLPCDDAGYCHSTAEALREGESSVVLPP